MVYRYRIQNLNYPWDKVFERRTFKGVMLDVIVKEDLGRRVRGALAG